MAESPRPKIFITHSWRDIDFTRRLYNDLKAQGFEVWFDDKSMQAGHRMAEEINRGLEWCDVYIPILSQAAVESPWCWEEVNAAIALSFQAGRNGRPRIIPVLIEACDLPALLRARLYINFAGRYEDALKELGQKGLGTERVVTDMPPIVPQTQVVPQVKERNARISRRKGERHRPVRKSEALTAKRIETKRTLKEKRLLERVASGRAKFFITHSHKDNRFANRLYKDLRVHGVDGFFDVVSIRPGDNIASRVNRGLKECDIFIPILSRAALKPGWCEDEINAAFGLKNGTDQSGNVRMKPRIVPVLVENCEDFMPPLLGGILYIKFSGRYGIALRELLEDGLGLHTKNSPAKGTNT